MFSTISSKKSALPSINFMISYGQSQDHLSFHLKYIGSPIEANHNYSDYKEQLDYLIKHHKIDHEKLFKEKEVTILLFIHHTDIKNQSEHYHALKAFITQLTPVTESFFKENENQFCKHDAEPSSLKQHR